MRTLSGNLIVPIFWAAFALGVVYRVLAIADAPLWFDEAYTGTIASQPTVEGLIDWCLNELSGPLYYSSIWLWQKLAGAGDTALRVPSLFCSIITPLFVLRFGPADRTTRYVWAALLALWMPGIFYTTQARPYALIFLFAVLQCVAFLRMMSDKTSRTTVIWATLSSLAILTHYYSLLITCVQGLFFLLSDRRNISRHARAWAIFCLPLGWIVLNYSFVARFLGSGAPYPLLNIWYPVDILNRMAGFPIMAIVYPLPVIGWIVARFSGQLKAGRDAASFALGLSGLVSVGAIFVLGCIFSIYSPRYLTAYVPALAFGLATIVSRLNATYPSFAKAYVLAVVLLTALNLQSFTKRAANDFNYTLHFSEASDVIMQSNARSVVFFWDNPTMTVNAPKRMAQVAGFFFDRASQHKSIDVARLFPQDDPAVELSRRALASHSAILWLYDTSAALTQAGKRAPNLRALSAHFVCRDFHFDRVHNIACVPR